MSLSFKISIPVLVTFDPIIGMMTTIYFVYNVITIT